MYIEGINPAETYQAGLLESPVPHSVGARGMDNVGREYVFQHAPGALVAGDVVQVSLGASGQALALNTAGALYNRQVGVAPVAVAGSGYGFWAQVLGVAFAGVRALVAGGANLPSYTTANAGAVSGTAAASNIVRGLTFTTAPTGPGVFAALLNNPRIGTVADTDNNT